MNKLTVITVMAAALMSAGLASASDKHDKMYTHQAMSHAHSHHGHGMHHHHKGGLPYGYKKLNLTAAQETEIKKILESSRTDNATEHHMYHHKSLQDKMQQRLNQEQQLLSGKTFNEQMARQMIAQRHQEHANLMREHAEHELRMLKTEHVVFQVLTPEQQKQFWAQQKQRIEKYGNMMNKKYN
ncbi:MAG: Spy/CpxP family protein refolding chaperone [Alysiella sp.]|uniref:Spy/CpxP family protein refolding chaperone n=1 Tax=Alysiella sp. TaxID=1872483 RepID=UPI0026DB2350|nr:Spy/CpxP family protein refolding chaperone [Alysiella sp.]MDO4433511.1 Spy/CpxP family protein refolding chaperone [Alysiella sp.]